MKIIKVKLLTLVDQFGALANQSLKLTEPAVDDFAARRRTDLAPLIGTSAQ